MKVYSVVHVSMPSEDCMFFFGFNDAPTIAFDNLEAAEETATDYARRHPGETFWVIKGEPSAAYRVEPAPVAVVDMASS